MPHATSCSEKGSILKVAEPLQFHIKDVLHDMYGGILSSTIIVSLFTQKNIVNEKGHKMFAIYVIRIMLFITKNMKLFAFSHILLTINLKETSHIKFTRIQGKVYARCFNVPSTRDVVKIL